MTQATLFEQITEVARPKDTRARAFDKIKPTAKQLRIRLLKDFYERAFTADEWAIEKGLSISSIRPRVSELNKKHLLHRVGFGLTIDGNDQNKYTLYPAIRNQIQLLACRVGIEKAAAEMLARFGL